MSESESEKLKISPQAVTKLDCTTLGAREIGEQLGAAESDSCWELAGLSRELSGLGAGCETEFQVKITGNVGDFAFMLSRNGEWEVNGKVGVCCGHSLVSGRVVVHESAAECVGANMQGGFIAVLGTAARRCGFRKSGGDILIRSAVGDEAGAFMTQGDLVLANGAGDNLGIGMTGGAIYLRGEARSVAPGLRIERMRDADSMRLSLLLARAGVRGDIKEFKLYRPRGI